MAMCHGPKLQCVMITSFVRNQCHKDVKFSLFCSFVPITFDDIWQVRCQKLSIFLYNHWLWISSWIVVWHCLVNTWTLLCAVRSRETCYRHQHSQTCCCGRQLHRADWSLCWQSSVRHQVFAPHSITNAIRLVLKTWPPVLSPPVTQSTWTRSAIFVSYSRQMTWAF